MIRTKLRLAAAVLALAPVISLGCDQPDGTMELAGGSIAAGVGFSWASGTLHYQGRSIPIHLQGLSIASVGGSSISASGDVCNLTRLADFNGNYTAVSAGATLAGGRSASAMRNQNGVVVHLRSSNQGLQFNLSIDGVAMRVAAQ